MISYFIYGLPPSILATIVLIASISISISCLFFCRKFVRVAKKEEDTNIIEIYSDAFGVAFAVLLGLLIVNSWNAYDQTNNQVRQEAIYISDLYKKSLLLNEEDRSKLRSNLKTYVSDMINLEWPLLSQGGHSPKVNQDIFRIFDTLYYSKKTNEQEWFFAQQLNTLATQLNDERSSYLLNSTSSVTPIMWVILILSNIVAFFLLALTTRAPFSLHLLLQTLYAFGTSLMLLLIIVLDRPFYPFGGEITPYPLQILLSEWEGEQQHESLAPGVVPTSPAFTGPI
ncbi:MAG: DUF4239 domain-containing protein [Alphaproteobacteria bacterium]|nr:DUF4239 domain-containing protein [Alphaproteobacteria bacterium]